jgi:hypothetical protein
MAKLFRPRFSAAIGALACLALLLPGCSGGIDLAPAEGIVTLNGEPIEGAAVMFIPDAGGPAATGVTNAQGQFALHTTNEPGALVGPHRVTVIKNEMSGLVDGLPGPGGVKTTWTTPQRYSRPETSGLVAEVKKGRNTFDFPLLSN